MTRPIPLQSDIAFQGHNCLSGGEGGRGRGEEGEGGRGEGGGRGDIVLKIKLHQTMQFFLQAANGN